MFIENKPNLNAKISEAFNYVKARPDITAVMITVFFTATFGLNFMIFNTLMATKFFIKARHLMERSVVSWLSGH